jgi:hypothetical protein
MYKEFYMVGSRDMEYAWGEPQEDGVPASTAVQHTGEVDLAYRTVVDPAARDDVARALGAVMNG